MSKAHLFTRGKTGDAPARAERPQLQLFAGARPRRPRWSVRLLDLLERVRSEVWRLKLEGHVFRRHIALRQWAARTRHWSHWQSDPWAKRSPGGPRRPRLTRGIARDIWAAASWASRSPEAGLSRREVKQLMDWAKRLYAWAQWSE